MQIRSLGLLLSGLLALASGCDGCSDRRLPAAIPEDAAARYAAAICAAEEYCGCQIYESRTDCELDISTAFERTTVAVSSFDENCFESILTHTDLQNCVDTTEAKLDCVAIVGSASEGEACERDPRLRFVMSAGGTCGAGMICDLGTSQCVKSPSGQLNKQQGDPCVPHHLASCGLDLYCDASGTCQTRTLAGNPCDNPHECEVGAFCASAVGVCTPKRDIGEACDPADKGVCNYIIVSESAESTWCNPQTSLCDVYDPLVCTSLDAPFPP